MKRSLVLMVSVLWLIPAICFAGPPVRGEPTTMEIRKNRKMLDAIRKVETGHLTADKARNARGKAGELGPYQIKRCYFEDSGIKGRYDQVRDKAFAEKVVVAYMKRYAVPKRLKRKVYHTDKARIHNGGPNGYKKGSTLSFRAKYLKYYGSE